MSTPAPQILTAKYGGYHDPGRAATPVVDDLAERVADVAVQQCGADGRDKERGAFRPWLEPVPLLGIGGQRGHGAGVEGDKPGFAELRVAHDDHRFGPQQVGPLEADRLTHPHARRGEQPDQRLHRRGPAGQSLRAWATAACGVEVNG